jgi:copper(I)-binding protein
MSLTLADEDQDRLLHAAADLAAGTQILAPAGVKASGRLVTVPAIALDGHAPTILEPGATHLILRGLKRPLRPGDTVPVTLEFEHAPAVTLPVKVLRDPPGTGMPDLPKGIRLE